MSRTTIPLATGSVAIDVARADWPLDRLCGFAARDNPRRAFLVVSKVLGRHVPVAPSVMRASFRDLAARIPDLPGPVLVIGLAETAICLGQGVHEELRRRWRRDDVLSLHSTRQQLDHPLLARFEEPHSHASSHLLYRPDDLRFAQARSLVLVDDEVSSGTTLVNLATAIVAAMPTLERIVAVSLTDWSNGDVARRMPLPATAISLVSGSLDWTAGAQPPRHEPPAFDVAARALGTLTRHHNFGRLGRSDIADERDGLADTLALPRSARLRVVGTCEFTYPPFRLAERLEQAGHDVVVQSTTRSPALIGGAITSRIAFADNYATGVANFLYNATDDDRLTLICHETQRDSIDPLLIDRLGARTLYFGD
jgi:hypothetical protein